MSNKIQKLKGTKDYFELEAEQLLHLFYQFRMIARSFYYQEIDFPVLERKELFATSIGEETDIVNKEMFSFADKKGREIVLRPEGTASTVRLVLENKLLSQQKELRFFYLQKMFRYERPQRGRQREFFQFGIENFNNKSLDNEMEIIIFAQTLLQKFKISKYQLQINSIGSAESRKNYNIELKKYLQKNREALSDDSKQRLDKNILRILDSKDLGDQRVLQAAPKITDYLSETEQKSYLELKKLLNSQKIPFVENPLLVRGLDYYNDLVFEFVSLDQGNLGAKDTIIGGGRYDHLVNKFDERLDAPAIGFALGIERFILAASDYFEQLTSAGLDYYLVLLDQKYYHLVQKVAEQFRAKGSVYLNYNFDQNIKKNLKLALKMQAKYFIIIDKNIEKGKVLIKNLAKNQQSELEIF